MQPPLSILKSKALIYSPFLADTVALNFLHREKKQLNLKSNILVIFIYFVTRNIKSANLKSDKINILFNKYFDKSTEFNQLTSHLTRSYQMTQQYTYSESLWLSML